MPTRTVAALVTLLSLAPATALAQNPAAAPKIELELYGGLGRFLDAGAATVTPPAAGAPIGTSSPIDRKSTRLNSSH